MASHHWQLEVLLVVLEPAVVASRPDYIVNIVL